RRQGAGGAPLRQGGGRQGARAAARRRAPPRERPGDTPPHHRGPRRGREGVPREAQASLFGHVSAVVFAYYARLTRAQQAIYRKSDALTGVRLKDSFQTEGFYKRESSLFYQLVPERRTVMVTIEERLKLPPEANLERMERTATDLAAAIKGQREAALSRRPDPKNWAAKEV